MADPCGHFSRSTGTLRISCLLSLTALILQIVGLTTNYWKVFEKKNYAGIWQKCICESQFSTILSGETGCHCIAYDTLPDWLLSVRALETLGTVCLVLLSVLHVGQIFFINSTPIKFVGILLAAVSGIVVLLGVAIYGSKGDVKERGRDDLSYSFFLCTISGCVSFISAVLLLVDKVQTSRDAETSGQSRREVKYQQQEQVVNIPPERQPLA